MMAQLIAGNYGKLSFERWELPTDIGRQALSQQFRHSVVFRAFAHVVASDAAVRDAMLEIVMGKIYELASRSGGVI